MVPGCGSTWWAMARGCSRNNALLLIALAAAATVGLQRWPAAQLAQGGAASSQPHHRLRPPPGASPSCGVAGRCCSEPVVCAELYAADAAARAAGAAACAAPGAPQHHGQPPPVWAALRGAGRVVVVGDSTARRVYEALWARLLVPAPADQPRVGRRNGDHHTQLESGAEPGAGRLVLEFLWRPFAANVRRPH